MEANTNSALEYIHTYRLGDLDGLANACPAGFVAKEYKGAEKGALRGG